MRPNLHAHNKKTLNLHAHLKKTLLQAEAAKWQTVPGLMPVMQREEVYM
jgi:hypothetical protein